MHQKKLWLRLGSILSDNKNEPICLSQCFTITKEKQNARSVNGDRFLCFMLLHYIFILMISLLQFPTITICNRNYWKESLLSSNATTDYQRNQSISILKDLYTNPEGVNYYEGKYVDCGSSPCCWCIYTVVYWQRNTCVFLIALKDVTESGVVLPLSGFPPHPWVRFSFAVN